MDIIHHFFDSLMLAISSRFFWSPLYALLIYFIFREKKWYGFLTLVFVALTITASDQISVHAFKDVFMRLRPCHQPEVSPLLHMVKYCGGKYGFVSSHAANSFSVLAFLTFFFRNWKKYKWVKWVLWVWALLIIYSRVYLGVHYPGDVLGGAIVGYIIGLIIYYFYRLTETSIFKQEGLQKNIE